MLSNKAAYGVLAVILAGYLAIGALYAVNTPPWQSPDEPAHYNAIAQIAADGCCPVIASGDWNSDQLDALKAEGFPEGADLSGIEYEDHQPPLYYLLGAVVYLAFNGDLLALRLMSLLMGAGVITAAYVAMARVYPRQLVIALAATAFVAFLPQHIAMMASVNNDSLAGMVLGILLVVCITYAGSPTQPNNKAQMEAFDVSRRPHAAALGGLAGIAFLTKLTIYLPAVLVVAAAILARWRIEKRDTRWLIEQAGWAGGMALVFGLMWWVRNVSVYGWPDIVGLARHNEVVVGQLRTADFIAQVGQTEYVRQYLTDVYHSFFGQFGWMGVPMPNRDYEYIGAFMLIALGGLIHAGRARSFPLENYPAQRIAFWILLGALVGGIVGLVQYNFTFVQFQGRYLYPALIPLAALVALGLWGWVQFAARWREAWIGWISWAPVAALVWMPALCLRALYLYIIPNLK